MLGLHLGCSFFQVRGLVLACLESLLDSIHLIHQVPEHLVLPRFLLVLRLAELFLQGSCVLFQVLCLSLGFLQLFLHFLHLLLVLIVARGSFLHLLPQVLRLLLVLVLLLDKLLAPLISLPPDFRHLQFQLFHIRPLLLSFHIGSIFIHLLLLHFLRMLLVQIAYLVLQFFLLHLLHLDVLLQLLHLVGRLPQLLVERLELDLLLSDVLLEAFLSLLKTGILLV